MNEIVRFKVESAHCERAKEELAAMLFRQDRGFAERWRKRRSVRGTLAVLRVFGALLGLVSFLLTVTVMWFDARERSLDNIGFLILFAAGVVLFVRFQKIVDAIHARGEGWLRSRSVRRARWVLKVASKLAPYEANYDVKGHLLTYTRCKDGEWQFGWHRNLRQFRQRGLALQGQFMTAVFRRPTSLFPSIIILHTDGNWAAVLLNGVGVKVESFRIDANDSA